MKRCLFYIMVIWVLLFISGCANFNANMNRLFGCSRIYKIQANAFLGIPKKIPMGASFVVAERKDISNPLFEREIKSKIEKLLIKNGYTIEDENNAEYGLIFDYAINDGTQVTYAVPVDHPGETIYHSGNISYGMQGRYSSSESYSGGGSYSGTTKIPGYTSYVPASATLYTRGLLICVFNSEEAKLKGAEAKPAWMCITESTGTSLDLRDVVDYLLVATFKYFGQNTGRKIQTNLYDDNIEVQQLRQY